MLRTNSVVQRLSHLIQLGIVKPHFFAFRSLMSAAVLLILSVNVVHFVEVSIPIGVIEPILRLWCLVYSKSLVQLNLSCWDSNLDSTASAYLLGLYIHNRLVVIETFSSRWCRFTIMKYISPVVSYHRRVRTYEYCISHWYVFSGCTNRKPLKSCRMTNRT